MQYRNITLEKLKTMNRRRRSQLRQDIYREVSDVFADQIEHYDVGITRPFIHRKSGIEFQWIPSGIYAMGLGKEEEKAAKRISNPPPITEEEMRPVTTVKVESFFISVTPVLTRDYCRITNHKSHHNDQLNHPIVVKHGEARSFAESIGCRLPYEREWEYACRGGSKTLFCWGDELLDDAELRQWVSKDFSGLQSLRPNGFGLYSLFSGEWCMDRWKPSYENNEEAAANVFVVRGGGGDLWPWQGDEWGMCISAFRFPSTDLLEHGCAGFRLVYSMIET